MKAFYIATIVSAAATLTSAIPVAEMASVEARNDIDARDIYAKFCTNEDFKGQCFDLLNLHQCTNAGAANNRISSLRTFGHTCILYDNADCSGADAELHGYYPRLPKKFNNKFSSVKCR